MAHKLSYGRPRVTVAQLRVLLKAVEKDPSLYNASQSEMIAYLNLQKWLDLSDELNDCDDGALLNTQSWKFVLRYWSDNIKKSANVSPKKRLAVHKKNSSITLKQAKELTRLERRFYNFMKKEEARDIMDVTYTGNFRTDPPPNQDSFIPPADPEIKVKVQLVNYFPAYNDENQCPMRAKKRTIVVKEDNVTDPADVTKKLRVLFDENIMGECEYYGDLDEEFLEIHLDRLHLVSRELEEHIGTVQSRIHMIKSLWKHRCGDN